jgi:triosephosphate isomerase
MDEIAQMNARIRRCLQARIGRDRKVVRILYGGSVKPDNARERLALDEVGGVLVGGASLHATDYAAMIGAAPLSARPSVIVRGLRKCKGSRVRAQSHRS